MTIIVKEGMEDWNHAIDKGYGKKIMIFKEKLNSIASLVQCVKIFADSVELSGMSSSVRHSA